MNSPLRPEGTKRRDSYYLFQKKYALHFRVLLLYLRCLSLLEDESGLGREKVPRLGGGQDSPF